MSGCMKNWLPTCDEMTNLSKGLRKKLKETYGLYVAGTVVERA